VCLRLASNHFQLVCKPSELGGSLLSLPESARFAGTLQWAKSAKSHSNCLQFVAGRSNNGIKHAKDVWALSDSIESDNLVTVQLPLQSQRQTAPKPDGLETRNTEQKPERARRSKVKVEESHRDSSTKRPNIGALVPRRKLQPKAASSSQQRDVPSKSTNANVKQEKPRSKLCFQSFAAGKKAVALKELPPSVKRSSAAIVQNRLNCSSAVPADAHELQCKWDSFVDSHFAADSDMDQFYADFTLFANQLKLSRTASSQKATDSQMRRIVAWFHMQYNQSAVTGIAVSSKNGNRMLKSRSAPRFLHLAALISDSQRCVAFASFIAKLGLAASTKVGYLRCLQAMLKLVSKQLVNCTIAEIEGASQAHQSLIKLIQILDADKNRRRATIKSKAFLQSNNKFVELDQFVAMLKALLQILSDIMRKYGADAFIQMNESLLKSLGAIGVIGKNANPAFTNADSLQSLQSGDSDASDCSNSFNSNQIAVESRQLSREDLQRYSHAFAVLIGVIFPQRNQVLVDLSLDALKTVSFSSNCQGNYSFGDWSIGVSEFNSGAAQLQRHDAEQSSIAANRFCFAWMASHEKNSKYRKQERILPFPTALNGAFAFYLAVVRPQLLKLRLCHFMNEGMEGVELDAASSSNRLILTHKGLDLESSNITNLVKKATCELMGISLAPRDLRFTVSALVHSNEKIPEEAKQHFRMLLNHTKATSSLYYMFYASSDSLLSSLLQQNDLVSAIYKAQ